MQFVQSMNNLQQFSKNSSEADENQVYLLTTNRISVCLNYDMKTKDEIVKNWLPR
jgi:spore maturation protein SpmA